MVDFHLQRLSFFDIYDSDAGWQGAQNKILHHFAVSSFANSLVHFLWYFKTLKQDVRCQSTGFLFLLCFFLDFAEKNTYRFYYHNLAETRTNSSSFDFHLTFISYSLRLFLAPTFDRSKWVIDRLIIIIIISSMLRIVKIANNNKIVEFFVITWQQQSSCFCHVNRSIYCATTKHHTCDFITQNRLCFCGDQTVSEVGALLQNANQQEFAIVIKLQTQAAICRCSMFHNKFTIIVIYHISRVCLHFRTIRNITHMSVINFELRSFV